MQLQSGGGDDDAAGNQPSGSGTLSGGAIAGIAVAAAVVALAVVGGGWVLLRRQQRRQRTTGGEAGATSAPESCKTATESGLMPEARSWGSSQPPSSSAQGHSLSPSALGTLAGTQVWGGSMGSAGGMERNVQLRVPKVTSPFAAMAARGGGGAVAVGAGGPPVASPFALAAQARSSQPPSFGHPSSGAWGPLLASPAESEGLASLAGVPSVDAKAAGSSGGATGSASSSSAGRMLPELKAHIAAVSLPCWGAEGGSRGGAG